MFSLPEIKQNSSKVKLNDNFLTWVDNGLHLWSLVQNNINGMKQDTKVKRAKKNQKNN